MIPKRIRQVLAAFAGAVQIADREDFGARVGPRIGVDFLVVLAEGESPVALDLLLERSQIGGAGIAGALVFLAIYAQVGDLARRVLRRIGMPHDEARKSLQRLIPGVAVEPIGNVVVIGVRRRSHDDCRQRRGGQCPANRFHRRFVTCANSLVVASSSLICTALQIRVPVQ